MEKCCIKYDVLEQKTKVLEDINQFISRLKELEVIV